MSTPDTHTYWEARAPFYQIYDVFGRRLLESYMTQLNRKSKIQSLVDVGCGKGELFPIWKSLEIPRIVGLDFSEMMLDISRRRIERHDYGIELRHMDLREEYFPEIFDVAITRTVLMHIPAPEIKKAVSNLSEMSNRLLLFEYFEEVPTKELNRWCWLHDYPTLFKDLGYEQVNAIQRPDVAQMLFHFEK